MTRRTKWAIILVTVMTVASIPRLEAKEKHDLRFYGDYGLVGYWPMNEGKGYILRDVSGVAGPGDQVGCVWEKLGKSFCLKLGAPFEAGIDLKRPPLKNIAKKRSAETDGFGYVRLPINILCRLGRQEKMKNMTVMLWVKPIEGGVANPRQGRRVNVYMGGSVLFGIGRDGNWNGVVISTYRDEKALIKGPPVKDGQWTHLTMTVDDAIARFYVNGEEVKAKGGPALITNKRFPPTAKRAGYCMCISTQLYEGAKQSFPFKGFVSDLMIYNRCLPAEKVRLRYQNSLGEHQ